MFFHIICYKLKNAYIYFEMYFGWHINLYIEPLLIYFSLYALSVIHTWLDVTPFINGILDYK